MEIEIQNTNDYQKFYRIMREHGVEGESRNGLVLRLPGVTTLAYKRPWQRVNLSPVRDANPFFHLMESLAILGGLNDVKWLSRFASNIANYSDDGETFNAFYGTRLRSDWGDQLRGVIDHLNDNPNSRQAVCQIWDPADLQKDTKDKACNLLLIFSINDSELDMTVMNRSNDAIWGSVTGANVVHFSFVQEYIANKLCILQGKYYQVSNNMHVYTENPQWGSLCKELDEDGRYYDHNIEYPMAEQEDMLFQVGYTTFDKSLKDFLSRATEEYFIDPVTLKDRFLRHVAAPVYNAWIARKYSKNMDLCEIFLDQVRDTPWKTACENWVHRKEAAKNV